MSMPHLNLHLLHRTAQPQNNLRNHDPIPQDNDLTQSNPNQLRPLPIPSPRALQLPVYQQKTLSISLQSLPLRPSTLTALLRSGFSTSGDVMNSCLTEMASAENSNRDRAGNTSNGDTADTNVGNGNNSFGHFAKELGCSASQAADYAHEIDDALGSVGLPKVTAPIAGDNATIPHGADNDNDIMTPRPSIFPATAASILRSKANNHFPMNNNGRSRTAVGRQIVSFAQPLDVLLGGGFALSELTEIVGLPGVGKTQLAMQLCVDSRLPVTSGGVEGCAVVIDAEGSWSSAAGGDRLWSMAVAFVEHLKLSASKKLARRAREGAGATVNESAIDSLVPSWLTPESVLEGIHIFRVHDEASQTCTLYNLPNFLLEQEEKGRPVKLLVIDSMAFHYRVASSSSYSSNGSSNNKNNSLSNTHNLTRMAGFLTELASEFDLAVVAMNHLTTRIEKDDINNAGGTKLVPALGESWAHSITSRLMIDFHTTADASHSTGTHSMDEVRRCTLVKSPHKPPGNALFMITDKGIRGVPPQANKRARLN
ncbi:hypothetical protein ACHAXR_006205 [Thalassiosira sp. AJA248-18]